ncbi:Threonine-phosphate decarboxylase [Planococcus massiliensis]|uniref:threonine-phosphate decarboxylase n=1 Tax=Planococcus massiliensis TaxID=1499687 RepID=A0A098EKX2_9BACL|nr:threonine-phosphate decarboxylase CobD [Planococcus massiliensis]CEG21901.1 Threonine-phosphate decarboxylase [Planococcus massiliensis]
MKLPDHGANPHLLYQQLNIDYPERILDFSENVHPFGPPEFIRNSWHSLLELIERYPDPEGEPFRSAAARFHDVPMERVVTANGAAEIFTWLARRYQKKKVVLIEPAFSEYRKTLEAEEAQIVTVQLTEKNGWQLDMELLASSLEGCAAIYICNPHNPTGLLIEQQQMEFIAEACKKEGCELVIDEAFIDFAGEAFSFIPRQSSYPQTIIVRSMTKMYAIAGLRLGYAIGSPEIMRTLKQGAAHWNVNAISAQVGAECFNERIYRERVIASANEERERMTVFLEEHHCKVSSSAVNFLAFKLPEGKDSCRFFLDFLEQGLVLRHTKSFSGMDGKWFRIGMKSPAQMDQLQEAINRWLMAN